MEKKNAQTPDYLFPEIKVLESEWESAKEKLEPIEIMALCDCFRKLLNECFNSGIPRKIEKNSWDLLIEKFYVRLYQAVLDKHLTKESIKSILGLFSRQRAGDFVLRLLEESRVPEELAEELWNTRLKQTDASEALSDECSLDENAITRINRNLNYIYGMLNKKDSDKPAKRRRYFYIHPDKICSHTNYNQLKAAGVNIESIFENIKGREDFLAVNIRKLCNPALQVLLYEMCIDCCQCSSEFLLVYVENLREALSKGIRVDSRHQEKILCAIKSFKDCRETSRVVSSFATYCRSVDRKDYLEELVPLLKLQAKYDRFSASALASVAYFLQDEDLITHSLLLLGPIASTEAPLAVSFGTLVRYRLYNQLKRGPNPKDKTSMVIYGEQKKEVTFLNEAIGCLRKFAREDCRCATTMGVIAYNIDDMGIMQEALAYLENHRKDIISWGIYGLLARKLHNKPKMMDAMQAIKHSTRSNIQSAMVFAVLAKASGNMEGEAIKALESFVSRVCDDRRLINTLAIMYNNNDRMYDAEALLLSHEHLFKDAPENFAHTLAVSYLRRGLYQQAASTLTDRNGNPLYPNDVHRMTTLQSAQRRLRGETVDEEQDLESTFEFEPCLLS